MTKPFPLQPLLDLSQMRVDDAARKLGQLLASEQEGEKTLQMLIQYRDEYEARFRTAAKSGMKPNEWSNYRHFLDRIDEAVRVQRKRLEDSHTRTVQGQKDWVSQRNRLKAFDTLSQRHKATEVRAENRAEQRTQDEHAAKQFRKEQ